MLVIFHFNLQRPTKFWFKSIEVVGFDSHDYRIFCYAFGPFWKEGLVLISISCDAFLFAMIFRGGHPKIIDLFENLMFCIEMEYHIGSVGSARVDKPSRCWPAIAYYDYLYLAYLNGGQTTDRPCVFCVVCVCVYIVRLSVCLSIQPSIHPFIHMLSDRQFVSLCALLSWGFPWQICCLFSIVVVAVVFGIKDHILRLLSDWWHALVYFLFCVFEKINRNHTHTNPISFTFSFVDLLLLGSE